MELFRLKNLKPSGCQQRVAVGRKKQRTPLWQVSALGQRNFFVGSGREIHACCHQRLRQVWQLSKQNHFLCFRDFLCLKQFLLQEPAPKDNSSSQKWVICIIEAEFQWTRLGLIIMYFKMSDRFSNTFHPYMDIDKILLWRHSVSHSFPHYSIFLGYIFNWLQWLHTCLFLNLLSCSQMLGY